MVAACAASRAHSVTSRRAASTQLIAVPQAPAPSTATRVIDAGSYPRHLVARDFDARPELGRRRVLLLLQVERFERERRQDHRREAAARDHVRDGLAQIRIDHRRAGDAEQRSELFGRHAAQLKDTGLARLGEKQRALAEARGDRRGDADFVIALGEIFRAGVDLHLELRLHLLEEHLRRVRDLERHVLHVHLFDLEGGGLRRLRFGHEEAFSSGSRPPWRSRSYRSSQPPMWRAPIQICGTVRRPLLCCISARRAGSRSTRILSIVTPFSTSNRSAAWQNGQAAVQYISTFNYFSTGSPACCHAPMPPESVATRVKPCFLSAAAAFAARSPASS